MPIQIWVSIIELGCFAGLMGLGFSFVLRGAGIFMFAMGPFAMVSAMVASKAFIEHSVPTPIAILSGIAVAVILCILTEIYVVRPINLRTHGDEHASVVAVVAVLFAVEQASGAIFGRRPLQGVKWTDGEAIDVGDAVVPMMSIVLMVVTVAMFIAVAQWSRRAALGQMLRAVGNNEPAARLLGLPVNKVRVTAFALAGLTAGVAGSLFASKAGVSFTTGLNWSLAGFIGVIVGGLGNVWAPLLGGFIVAATQTLAIYFLGPAALDYATFVLAFLFFAFRPMGLFQTKVRV